MNSPLSLHWIKKGFLCSRLWISTEDPLPPSGNKIESPVAHRGVCMFEPWFGNLVAGRNFIPLASILLYFLKEKNPRLVFKAVFIVIL